MKKVVHFEIPSKDLERAKKFHSIFDWHLRDWPMPDGSTYVGARTIETDDTTYQPKEPGAINGGIVLRDEYPITTSLTINVPSIDEYQEKVKTAGGSVVKPKELIGGMGYHANVNATEGNLLGGYQAIGFGVNNEFTGCCT